MLEEGTWNAAPRVRAAAAPAPSTRMKMRKTHLASKPRRARFPEGEELQDGGPEDVLDLLLGRLIDALLEVASSIVRWCSSLAWSQSFCYKN